MNSSEVNTKVYDFRVKEAENLIGDQNESNKWRITKETRVENKASFITF